MQVILPLIYTILFILLIRKIKFFSIPGLSRKAIIFVFLLKICAGIALLQIFTKYYQGSDSIAFFNDSKIMYGALWQNPAHFFKMFFGIDSSNEVLNIYYSKMNAWNASFEKILFNDSRSLIRLNVLFRFFSFGNFYVHTVFMCFLSLTGLTALYKTFSGYFLDKKKILFVIIFLLPSVLFWSSGVMKEGLLFFAMGLLLYITECGLLKNYDIKKNILILLLIAILLFVKFYILIALIPGLFANYWLSRSSMNHIFLKYISVFAFCFLFLALVAVLKPQYNVLNIIANKQQKSEAISKGGTFLLSTHYFIRIGYNQENNTLIHVKENYYRIKPNNDYDAWEITNLTDTLKMKNSADTALYKLLYSVSPSYSTIAPLKLNSSLGSLLKNTPAAFYNALTQPLSFFTKDLLKIAASLENVCYIMCILLGVFCFKIPEKNNEILFFCFSVFVFVFVLAGLTTPITGALVRYKTPVLPFMMIFIFMLIDNEKWKKIPILGTYFNS